MNRTFTPGSRRLVAVVVALGLMVPGLAGCTHASPEPSPAATAAPPPTDLQPITPRRTPTPAAVASTTPSSTTVTSAVTPGTSEDPLYQKAVSVYQTFVDEHTKVLNAGGADKLPAGLAQTLSPDLRTTFGESLAFYKQKGRHYPDGLQRHIQSVTPYAADPSFGGVVAIQTCEHNVGLLLEADGQPVGLPPERWQVNNVVFGYASSGTRLVITRIWTVKGVPCPAS